MKKSLFLVSAALIACMAANAQVDNNAIGLRFGGGSISGAEVSYQLGLSDANRLETDLGFGSGDDYSGANLAAVYQWVWPIGVQGFNWFAGPGASLGFYNGKKGHDDFTGLGIGGQAGVGYDFNIPLGLTLDTRPMWDLFADDNAFGWGICLGMRYRF